MVEVRGAAAQHERRDRDGPGGGVVQAGSGDIVADRAYLALYNEALDSGNGGLALFGAWSLFTFVVATIGTLVKLTIVGGIVALVIWILVKGYQGAPDD